MPGTTHFGGSGGGMTVSTSVVLTFAAPFVTVSVTVQVPGAKPCVAVWPVACAEPSPKSHE